MSEKLLTVAQVAERLQVHPRTVRRAIDASGLRAVQVAGRGTWRVRPEDLDAWLEQRTNTSHTQADDTPRRPVARIAAAPRGHRGGRPAGVLAVTPGMGRTA